MIFGFVHNPQIKTFGCAWRECVLHKDSAAGEYKGEAVGVPKLTLLSEMEGRQRQKGLLGWGGRGLREDRKREGKPFFVCVL